MRLRVTVLCAFLALGSVAFGSSRNQREHGALVFNSSGCRHCHSIDSVGGHKGPDLSGLGLRLTKAQIRTQILRGGGAMPPFTNDLEPAEVKDLVAYLRSCREKPRKQRP